MGYYLGDMIGDYLEHDNTYDVFYYCNRGIAQALVREKLIAKLGEEEMERIHNMDEDEDGQNGEEYLYELEEQRVKEVEKEVEKAIDRIRRSL